MPTEQMDDKLETSADIATGNEASAADNQETKAKKKKTSFLIVPIPQSSPTLGSGVTVTASLFYNPNGSKDPWITGIGAMKTSNGSKAIGALQKMALDHDRFRLALFGGYGSVNMRFYGIGDAAEKRDLSIQLNEKGYAGFVHGQMRIADNLYLGGRALYLNLNTSIRRDNPLFPDSEIPTRGFKSTLVKAGPILTYDSRDSGLTTTRGAVVNASWLFGIDGLGSDFTHNKLTIDASVFRPLSKSTVIAIRAAACRTSNAAPFYDLCMYGASSDLRGYETGKYRDHATWAAQAELRQHLFWRVGAVAFGGIGMSAPDWSRISDGRLLPSAGVGLRFRPTKSTPVNLRIDYARGRDGGAMYIGIGEAF